MLRGAQKAVVSMFMSILSFHSSFEVIPIVMQHRPHITSILPLMNISQTSNSLSTFHLSRQTKFCELAKPRDEDTTAGSKKERAAP